MANIKVSEMNELTQSGDLENEYVYVAKKTRTDTYDSTPYKKSLGTISREIVNEAQGDGATFEIKNANIPQWGASFQLDNGTYQLPCDCFVWGGGLNYSDSKLTFTYPQLTIDGIPNGRFNNGILMSGIYCAKGTVITSQNVDSRGHANIAPLLYGNMDEDKCIYETKITPATLATKITELTGTVFDSSLSGGGIYARQTSSGSWTRITSTTSADTEWQQFGIKLKLISSEIVATISCPGTVSKYEKFMNGNTNAITRYGISTATVSTPTTIWTGSSSVKLKKDQFPCITLKVYDFRTTQT